MNQELYTKLKYLSVINSAVTCSAAMFRKGKCSQTRLCSQRTATFALAVCYSKHTPIIGIFSPFKNTFRHSEILTHLEKSWQNKCEPKRIKLTCSNVKHPMYNSASGTPEFNKNSAQHKIQLLFHAPVCSSSSWHVVQGEWGKPGVEMDRTRGNPQNHPWSRYRPAWLRSKGEKWKGTGQGQLAPSRGGK